MKTQVEDHISFEENQRQRLRGALQEAEKIQKQLKAAVVGCQRGIGQHQKMSMDLKVEAQRADQEAEQLQNAVDNETVEEGRLEVLKLNLATLREDRSRTELMYEDAVLDRDEQKSKCADKKHRLDLMDVLLATTKASHSSARKVFAKKEDERYQALLAKNVASDEVTKLNEARSETEKLRKQTSELVLDWSSRAAEIGNRVPILSGETSASIEMKLSKLDDEVKMNEKR